MTPDKQALIPSTLAEYGDRYHYSPGVIVEGSRLIFVAGQVGRDADGNPLENPTDQYVAIFENIRAILERAGAHLRDVVDIGSYHVTFDDFHLFTEVKDRYIVGPVFPAWTAVAVAGLALPGLLAEVRCTAVLR